LPSGAICPQEGKGAALVLPRCDTPAMSLHLAEVAQAVAPGAQGVILMDRAGWYRAISQQTMSRKLWQADKDLVR
jgi:hypothetical protein